MNTAPETKTDPTDTPIYWFVVLECAVKDGDHQQAAEAQRQLERLGVRVAYGCRRKAVTRVAV